MSVVPSSRRPVLAVVPEPDQTVNQLSGYASGAWTPDPFAGVSLVGNFRGWYTKIGNVVTIAAYLDFNTKVGASGDVSIRGLPYPGRASGATVPNFQNVGMMPATFTMPTAGTVCGGRINAGTDFILLISYAANATPVAYDTVDVSAIAGTSFLYINCTYITDDD